MISIYLTAILVVNVVFAQQYFNADTGLVAYYPFNGSAIDESINTNDGIINGPTLIADRFGNDSAAYYFDGIDDFIDIGLDSSLFINDDISIVSWIFPEDTLEGSIVIADGNNNIPYRMEYGRYDIMFDRYPPSGGGVSINNVITLNEWNFVAISVNQDSSTIIFVVDDSVVTLPYTEIYSGESPSAIWIGAQNRYGSITSPFKGIIDDIRIYHNCLTIIDIDSLYHAGGWPINNFVEDDKNQIEFFKLQNNYPNPFNPTTTIGYTLSERTDVLITIYDLLGKEITTLVSEIQDAGFKSVQWNATNVASGVYFYQITAGDFVQTRKMVLLK